MSVSYAANKLRVPPGFEHLLEGLAREILREQPKNLVEFAAQYFRKKLQEREGGGVVATNDQTATPQVPSTEPVPTEVGSKEDDMTPSAVVAAENQQISTVDEHITQEEGVEGQGGEDRVEVETGGVEGQGEENRVEVETGGKEGQGEGSTVEVETGGKEGQGGENRVEVGTGGVEGQGEGSTVEVETGGVEGQGERSTVEVETGGKEGQGEENRVEVEETGVVAESGPSGDAEDEKMEVEGAMQSTTDVEKEPRQTVGDDERQGDQEVANATGEEAVASSVSQQNLTEDPVTQNKEGGGEGVGGEGEGKEGGGEEGEGGGEGEERREGEQGGGENVVVEEGTETSVTE